VEEIIGKKAKIEPKPKRPGDQLKTHANIAKARQILGYAPSTGVREGLEKEVEWYRDSCSKSW
jgi:nucleoside-diphosphate-sugar epimerase